MEGNGRQIETNRSVFCLMHGSKNHIKSVLSADATRRCIMRRSAIFIYKFNDGTSFHLLNAGFSIREIWALEEIHGKLTKQEVCQV